MRDRTVRALSTLHARLFQISGGRLGRRLVANDMAVLTTRGRVTGIPHAVPLLILRDGEQWIVIASYGGRPEHPEWYRNLVAHPQATLQVGAEDIAVEASTMGPDEREQWWTKVVDAHAGYAEYAARTDRQIPIVRLARHS